MTLLVSGLWLTVGTQANEKTTAALPQAEALPTLSVTIKSLSGGNFTSYSMPAVETTGTIDFKILSSAPESGGMIKFLKQDDDQDPMGYWYIPVQGSMKIDAVSNKSGREQVRLISEGQGGGRLRVELDYFKDHADVARVWFIYEHNGFIDSVAYGEAPLDKPILTDQASE